jgi:hypothetical protein
VQFIPSKFDAGEYDTQPFLQRFFLVQAQRKHYESESAEYNQSPDDLIDFNPTEPRQDGKQITDSHRNPNEHDQATMFFSLINEELLNQFLVPGHVTHLFFCDGSNFSQRFLIQFVRVSPAHIFEPVGDTCFEDGVHPFDGVLEKQPTHQDCGKAELPSSEVGYNEPNHKNPNGDRQQSRLDFQ